MISRRSLLALSLSLSFPMLVAASCGPRKADERAKLGRADSETTGKASPGTKVPDGETRASTPSAIEESKPGESVIKGGLVIKIGPLFATGLSLRTPDSKPLPIQMKLGEGYSNLDNKPAKSITVGPDVVGGNVTPFACDPTGLCNGVFTPYDGFRGPAAFSYTVSDGENTADAVALIIFGAPPPGAPASEAAKPAALLNCGASDYTVTFRQVLVVGPPLKNVSPEASPLCSGVSDPMGGVVTYRYRTNGCGLPTFQGNAVPLEGFKDILFNNVPSARACETVVEAVNAKGAVLPSSFSVKVTWRTLQ